MKNKNELNAAPETRSANAIPQSAIRIPKSDVSQLTHSAIRNPHSAIDNIEDIEVPLLVEAIYRRWGYDFRDYAPASLKRRIRRIVEAEGVPSVSALQERVLRDPACMQRFLDQ